MEIRVYVIRDRRVMLDQDLAVIYGVATRRLNQQVRRNRHRFPSDFAFQLSPQEASAMRSHSATASRRNVRHRPFVFTEHGIVMLAAVLNTRTAVAASVAITRAFVELRRAASETERLATRLKKVEERLDIHEERLRLVFEAVDASGEDAPAPAKEIGFRPQGSGPGCGHNL